MNESETENFKDCKLIDSIETNTAIFKIPELYDSIYLLNSKGIESVKNYYRNLGYDIFKVVCKVCYEMEHINNEVDLNNGIGIKSNCNINIKLWKTKEDKLIIEIYTIAKLEIN